MFLVWSSLSRERLLSVVSSIIKQKCFNKCDSTDIWFYLLLGGNSTYCSHDKKSSTNKSTLWHRRTNEGNNYWRLPVLIRCQVELKEDYDCACHSLTARRLTEEKTEWWTGKGKGGNWEGRNVRSGALEVFLAGNWSYHSDPMKALQQETKHRERAKEMMRDLEVLCHCVGLS